jgi:hypothetical protein
MTQYHESSSYPAPPQDHPQTTTILILGICSLVLCGALGPFAWSMGNKALREIDASHGQIGGRDTINVGRILGIVATVLLGLIVIGIIGFAILAVVFSVGSTTSTMGY